MNQKHFVSELSKLRPCSTFLTLLGYQNAASEVADYNLIFHFDYKNAVSRSLTMLQDVEVTAPLEVQAKQDILESLQRSLRRFKNSSVEELDDIYEYFTDKHGAYVKGIKRHRKTGVLYLYGLVNSKRVIVPGFYSDRSESDLSKTKRKLRQTLPVSKYRSFIVAPDKFDSISVEGKHFTP